MNTDSRIKNSTMSKMAHIVAAAIALVFALATVSAATPGKALAIEGGLGAAPALSTQAGANVVNGGNGTLSLEGAEIAGLAAQTYTGSQITPEITVTLEGTTLRNDADYTVEYTDNTGVGTAKVTVVGKGQYEGSRVEASFPIKAASIAKAVVAKIAAKTYTGSAIRPKPVVTFNGATLSPGIDYTLSYSNNKDAGTAQLIIKGEGNFNGTRTVSFTIDKASLKDVSVKGLSPVTYTGELVKPILAVTYNGRVLKFGSDYTVKLANNKAVGTATLVLKGAGNFQGTVNKTFRIKKAKNVVLATDMAISAKGGLNTGKLAEKKSFTLTAKSKWASKKLTYKKVNSAGGKYITVSSKGKVTLKRGLAKGTYNVKVKVTSKSTGNYVSRSKIITVSLTLS